MVVVVDDTMTENQKTSLKQSKSALIRQIQQTPDPAPQLPPEDPPRPKHSEAV